jgi:glutathione S-transferase
MSDPELILYHFPGACSQVTVYALEEAKLAYEIRLVDLRHDEQSRPDFLAISPLGKVPTLLIDGVPLTENAAILTYIAGLRPKAELLPDDGTPAGRADLVGGLVFCAGTLHPQVRGIANPQRLTTGDGAPVREKATALAGKSFSEADRRIADRGWWLGQASVIDVYLNWAFITACRGGFASAPFPALAALAGRLAAGRPAFRRMQAREADFRNRLGTPG